MKCLVSFACLLAVASAQYAPIGLTPEARQFDPVAIAAGAPLPTGDTYEVAAAKAAHLQAHAAARGSSYGPPANSYSGYNPVAPASYPGYSAPYAYSGYSAPFASPPREVDPVAIRAGAPLPTGDTPEVAAAKAAHLQVHAAAKGAAYSAPINQGYGQPAPFGYSGYAQPAPFAPHSRQVDPVAIRAGAPLPTGDTPEVAAAKAAHLQAHAAATAGHSIGKRSPVFLNAGYTAPLAYAARVHSYGYTALASPLAYGYPHYAHY